MPSRFVKDSAEVLDYKFDFTDYLAASETVASRVVTPDSGITKDSDTADATSVTAWLSGGTAGTSYKVVCHVTTSAGRQAERTITIDVRDR